MTVNELEILTEKPAGIARAGEILGNGGLIAFPTETVYGLGADARDDTAVARIYAAKDRPSFNPLIVHVADRAAADRYVIFNEDADRLAAAFWPGPLTLVLPLKPNADISKLVTAGLDTLAIRVPAHPIGQAILSAANCPVAAPSANPSGRISPTTAAHVIQGLGNNIDAVLDGGACGVGLESTIISCIKEPQLLRAGGLPLEAIQSCLGTEITQTLDAKTPTAPGQLASHYAPQGTVRLNVTDPKPDETLLGFGTVDAKINLSPSADLLEAAANLFDCLHQLDALKATKIAVSPIPNQGLGRAINDRLNRAAAPRD